MALAFQGILTVSWPGLPVSAVALEADLFVLKKGEERESCGFYS